jgi:uncharacterized GH25 family protein/beta-lactamase regulating signal transducer with metallopeptidase domain
MAWQSAMWYWLVYAAISSCLLFAAAVLAMMLTDQPARRLRFVQWAFLGALLAPLVNAVGVIPQWHAGLLGDETATAAPMRDLPAPAAPVAPRPSDTEPLPKIADNQPVNPDREPFQPAVVQPLAAAPENRAVAPQPRSAMVQERREETAQVPTTAAATESRIDVPALVLLAYCGIGGGLLLWSLLGLLRLLHLKRRSPRASEELRNEFLQIAGVADAASFGPEAGSFRRGDDSLARRVDLRVNDRMPAPLTFGWRRPVIVLPAAVCVPGAEQERRYCLAHEWDHVRRRDILPWQFASLLQALFFYQPMFWWLRRQLRLCQDYLADAFAAKQAVVPEDYAEFLVQQAKRCTVQYSAALGFVPSKSSLFRRVEMVLNDARVIVPRCRGWWSIAVGLAAIGLVAGVAAVRLDAGKAEPAAVDAKEKTHTKPQTKAETNRKKSKPEIPFRELRNGEDAKRLRQSGARVIGNCVLGAEATRKLLSLNKSEFQRALDRIETVKWKQAPFTKLNARLTMSQRFDDYVKTANDFYDGRGKRLKGVVGKRQLKYTDKELGDDQLSSALQSVQLAFAWSVPVEKQQIAALNDVIAKRIAAADKSKSITYSGVVVDRISKKPIPGTTVIIERTLSQPPKGMEDWKKISRVKSDANGRYSFTLGPEETAQSSLYIEVDAQHPEYVAKGRSGYAHSMILKNLKMGEKPFYATIELWPGKAVTGTVVTPDGKPVQGAEVLTYSKHSKSKRFSFGGFYTAHTDAKGRFRFIAATPGEGVYWVTPKGFTEQAFVIPEKRGDVGRIVLQHGHVLKGKVLDAKGKPVPHVQVEARRNGDGEDVDRFLGQNAVANHIGRTGQTNAKGEFRLDELPSGQYTLNVRPVRRGWGMELLKQVFVRQPLMIRDGERPAPLVIRAVPHVEIHITWRDSKGKPSGGWRTHVFGRMDKNFFFAQSSRVDRKTGHSVVRVPHGLQKTQMSVISNEHASLRWRLKAGDPLRAGYNADLGTLEADIDGFEVIRYVAPILLVKAVDENGKPLPNFKPKANYQKGKSPKDPNSRFINGVRGDVSFEKQTDGRWRSSQLLPDEKLTVTAVLDGYTTTTQTVTPKEGSSQELVFVMKRKTAAKPKAAGKKTAAKSITYTGRVLDHISGKPIEGATVTIERTVTSNGLRKTKEFQRTIRVTTNAKGQYSFTLLPDEVARPNLYITFRVEHANYADPGPRGNSHATIIKNRRLGESPFFSEIKLWPGKAVTAVVVAPDGSPVAGARITTFCKHDKAKQFDFHGFGETKTDKNGHFRFIVPSPGEGAFWIFPKGYAVYSQLIRKRRGDLGKLVVQKGARLRGRVLDAKGKPLAGIFVGARQTGSDGELIAFLSQNGIGNLTARSTHTNKNGEFELEDLPDGDYSLGADPSRNEVTEIAKHVFLQRSVKLSAAVKPAPLVFRAVPRVELRARWVDSKGKPARGYQFYVLGQLDGKSWVARSTRPDEKTGRTVVAVPHGLQDARLNLITNEHSSLRWRLKPGDALRRGRYVTLGNIDDDLSGIEIVHYAAPVLLLKPVDKNGKPVRDVTIQSQYESEKPPTKFRIRFSTGEIRFTRQSNGRWRSSQMLPDEKVTVTVKKDGYEAKPQTVSLKEGKERELVFVLKKK